MDDSSGISDHAGAVVIDPLTSLQLLGDSAAAAVALEDDRARHLKGFVGSVEVLLNHAQVHKRWKLAQTVAFVSHRGDHVGSCRILMRWDPLAGQTPPALHTAATSGRTSSSRPSRSSFNWAIDDKPETRLVYDAVGIPVDRTDTHNTTTLVAQLPLESER